MEHKSSELLPVLLGSFIASVILVVEHYGLKKSKLHPTDAYVAGTLALDVGYLVYLLKSGKSWKGVIPIFLIQSVGGMVVKGAYRIDGE
jgi:hypothetical protein